MNTSYKRAALVVYDPDGGAQPSRVIPFRFNPEGLTRELSVESSEDQTSQGSGQSQSSDDGASDSGGGDLKQTMTVVMRFDFEDRGEVSETLPEELGVAPEVAAVEDLVHPVSSESDAPNESSPEKQRRPQRPTVLFVWGQRHVFPVRITNMIITEMLHNAELYPVQAEIELSFEVLGEQEASEVAAVDSALKHNARERTELARRFLEQTSAQGTAGDLPEGFGT